MATFQAEYTITAVIRIEADNEDEAYERLEKVTEKDILNGIEDTEMVELLEIK